MSRATGPEPGVIPAGAAAAVLAPGGWLRGAVIASRPHATYGRVYVLDLGAEHLTVAARVVFDARSLPTEAARYSRQWGAA